MTAQILVDYSSEYVAKIWSFKSSISLGYRLCLAVGEF